METVTYTVDAIVPFRQAVETGIAYGGARVDCGTGNNTVQRNGRKEDEALTARSLCEIQAAFCRNDVVCEHCWHPGTGIRTRCGNVHYGVETVTKSCLGP